MDTKNKRSSSAVDDGAKRKKYKKSDDIQVETDHPSSSKSLKNGKGVEITYREKQLLTIRRFAWLDFRATCLAAHHTQFIRNCWAVALYRHWYALMRLSNSIVKPDMFSPSVIIEHIPLYLQSEGHGTSKGMRHITPFLVGFANLKKIKIHTKLDHSQNEDFELLLERLLIQGPFAVAMHYFPSYKDVEYMGVLCPSPLELETSLYRDYPGHVLLAYGTGEDMTTEIPKPYWDLYESQGPNHAERGFTRLQRHKGLIRYAVEMVLNDDKRIDVLEIELARRAMSEHCTGIPIMDVEIESVGKVIDEFSESVSRSDFCKSVLTKRIVSVHRKGTVLWVELDSPPHLTFQLGLESAIYLKGAEDTCLYSCAIKESDKWPNRYSTFCIMFDNGMELSFSDPQVKLLLHPTSVHPISKLAPDALLEPMTSELFAESLAKKNICIKALLLDECFISGIWNWLADEALYHARIHPLEIASSLSKKRCDVLHKFIREVIEAAVAAGGKSRGFPENWIFHSREAEPGSAFGDGKTVDFIAVRGWTTAYVPELQKLSWKEEGGARS